MKPVARALALVLAITSVVPAAGAQGVPEGRASFLNYQFAAELHCDDSVIYGSDGSGSPSWRDANPLRRADNPYRAVNDVGAINEYTKYLGELKADSSCLSETPTGIQQLDMAKCVYRETQNALFACSAAGSMLSMAQKVEKYFVGNGRAKEALEKKIESLKKIAVGDGTNESSCNAPKTQGGNAKAQGKTSSVTEGLLKNSSVQMCRYVYYLDYLSANADNNVQAFIGKTDLTGKREVPDTETAARMLAGVKAGIAGEQGRVRDVHRSAIEAFMEMERTYEIHLMLTLIYEDFVDVRERLRSLLNPIGQFVYKASNAQSPYNQ